MIEITKLTGLFKDIEGQEDRKKEIGAQIKDAFDSFAKSEEINVKSLKKAYKNWKEYQKSKEDFIETDTEADALTQVVIPEYREAA